MLNPITTTKPNNYTMYHKYFGLEEPAFSIAVNPRYLYMSKQHKEALAHLLYGVQGGGFVMLSGEVGTGKTTIIRSLLEQLPDNTEIAIVLNPMAEAIEILSTVCDELGIEYNKEQTTLKSLTDALQERLLENHRAGRNTVLLIDEAQLLSAEVLEQIRLLTNLETTTEKLLQIVLVGQPELNTLLAQPRLRQLSQRITARFHLKPLTVEETWAYVNHRLHVAGMPEDRNPFTPRIVKRIHDFTGGIPRKINILCERILIGTYGHNKAKVDGKIFQLAKSEVTGHGPESRGSGESVIWKFAAMASMACLILAVLGIAIFIFSEPDPVPLPVQSSTPVPAARAPTSATQAAKQTTTAEPVRSQSMQSVQAEPQPTVSTEPETTTVEVANEEPAVSTAEQYYNDPMQAQRALFSFMAVSVDEGNYPCWQLAEKNIDCRRTELGTWDELKEINRPAVLTLNTRDKLQNYAVITGITDNEAFLLDSEQQRFSIDLKELGPLWSGEIFYIWQRPPGYKEPISRGQRSETVSWLAKKFAFLDGQSSPLTNTHFNEKLEQRVKIFQRDHALSDDGIAGQQTLMKLNEVLGIDKTLVTSNESP